MAADIVLGSVVEIDSCSPFRSRGDVSVPPSRPALGSLFGQEIIFKLI